MTDRNSWLPPYAAPEKKKWWFQPSYWRSNFTDTIWSCAFCDYEEDDALGNYMKEGYECPECGAIFVDEHWMAQIVDEEWGTIAWA